MVEYFELPVDATAVVVSVEDLVVALALDDEPPPKRPEKKAIISIIMTTKTKTPNPDPLDFAAPAPVAFESVFP